MAVGGNSDYGHQHRPQLQQDHRTRQPSVATWAKMSPWPHVAATQISIFRRPLYYTHGHQHGFRQQPRPMTNRQPLVAPQATEISTDGGNRWGMDTDMAAIWLDLS